MKKILLIVAIISSLLLPSAAFAVNLPKATGFVNDYAGILSSSENKNLEKILKNFEAKTSNEIAVAIVNSFDGLEKFDYSQKLFASWKIGKKNKNNGILFLIGPKEGEPFPEKGETVINVGLGLEGTITDSLAGSILDNEVLPLFKEGKMPEGILAGVNALMAATSNEPPVSSLEPIDDNWDLYTNYKLGFSVEVPHKGKLEGHLQGNIEYFAYNEIKAIEKGNIVYISSGDEYQNSSIQKSIKSRKTEAKRVQGVSWAILIKKIKNDSQLKSLIKQKYGSSCKLGKKTKSSQEGVFDIEILGDGKDLGETRCPMNFITFMKYYPKLQRVATWDIGQAPNFEVNGEYVDDKMSDSFAFIDQ
ncbi:MAG: TPM domain-containing protein [Candidatus Gracilibacteria bacterium]